MVGKVCACQSVAIGLGVPVLSSSPQGGNANARASPLTSRTSLSVGGAWDPGLLPSFQMILGPLRIVASIEQILTMGCNVQVLHWMLGMERCPITDVECECALYPCSEM